MANSNGRTRAATILTAIVILATVVAAFVWAQADTRAVDTKATGIKESQAILKKEGCNPARQNKFDIGLVQKDIKAIQKSQEAMGTEQRKGFKEILDRLPVK